MEEFRLYGKQDRCVWCGEKGKENYKEISFKEGTKSAQPKKILVCSDKCENDLLENEKKYEGKAPLFFTGILIGLVLAIVGTVLYTTVNYNLLYLTALGVLFIGITVTFLPFVTPQTVQLIGYKKGMQLGNIFGMILILFGIGVAVLIFLIYPA